MTPRLCTTQKLVIGTLVLYLNLKDRFKCVLHQNISQTFHVVTRKVSFDRFDTLLKPSSYKDCYTISEHCNEIEGFDNEPLKTCCLYHLPARLKTCKDTHTPAVSVRVSTNDDFALCIYHDADRKYSRHIVDSSC